MKRTRGDRLRLQPLIYISNATTVVIENLRYWKPRGERKSNLKRDKDNYALGFFTKRSSIDLSAFYNIAARYIA